jgi:hypothetical protein
MSYTYIHANSTSLADILDPNFINKEHIFQTTINKEIKEIFQEDFVNKKITKRNNDTDKTNDFLKQENSNISSFSGLDGQVNKSLSENQMQALSNFKAQVKFNNFSIDKLDTQSVKQNVPLKSIIFMHSNSKVKKVLKKYDPLLIADLLKKSEENSIYTSYHKKTWVIDLIVFILIILNITFSLIDNEIYITYSDIFMKDYMDQHNITVMNIESLEVISQRLISPEENLFRILNGSFSVISCILLIIRYKIQIKLLQIDDKLSKYDTIFTSGLIWPLLLELCVCIIFYPPFINFIISGDTMGLLFIYNLNSVFSIFALMKLYSSIRVISYTSRWTTNTAVAICNKFRVKPGFQFMFKSEMRKRPTRILLFLLLLSLILLAFMLRTFEYGIIDPTSSKGLKISNDLSYLANCFWLISVTMMTVGYGDYFPSSHLGRFIGVIACIIGMLLLSLVVVSFSVITELTKEQKKALNKIQKRLAMDNLEDNAANVIKVILQIRRVNYQKSQKKLFKQFILLAKFKKCVTTFVENSRITRLHTVPIDDMLGLLDFKISKDLESLSGKINLLKNVDKEIDSIQNVQVEQTQRFHKVLEMQDKISEYLVKFNNLNFDKLYSQHEANNFDINNLGKSASSMDEINFKKKNNFELRK